jgi:Histidine kinase-, DNA gyrase B-, and HSP90-like ATPase
LDWIEVLLGSSRSLVRSAIERIHNTLRLRKVVFPVQIDGVDPGVVRELSGIYKPFVKAFKELVSNAYDADASSVFIHLADDFTEIKIVDNGIGMTPFDFKREFTRIGGSYKILAGSQTAKGRPKIGSKGIGFLAPARYCSKMCIKSKSVTSTYEGRAICSVRGGKANLLDQIDHAVPTELIIPRISIHSVVCISGGSRRSLPKKTAKLRSDGYIELKAHKGVKGWREIEVTYSVDCQDIELNATIDYDYILALENKKNLSDIDDFCAVRIEVVNPKDSRWRRQYTEITLEGLKPFVVNDLRATRKHGNSRNVESSSGIDRFLWHLKRSVPTQYELPDSIQSRTGDKKLITREIKFIDSIRFTGPCYENVELRRPVWESGVDATLDLEDDLCIKVDLNTEGFIAKGYVLGSPDIIHPAEYRGLAIRVRNIQIGSPNFLGLEDVVSGVTKATLSQITGEINVLKGMDAIDALNPGRESFYEDNPHFKLLKKYLVGDGESARGIVGDLINRIFNRSQVLSAVHHQIGHANQRRKALLALSQALTYCAREPRLHLRELFGGAEIVPNGLTLLPRYKTGPGNSANGFKVENRPGLERDYLADFGNKKIYLDFGHDRWSWRIFILGDSYEIVPKQGTENNPLCELDTLQKKIFLNWGHPLRQQMGDGFFMKAAIGWSIAYHASGGKIEDMMDLALRLQTHTES